MDEDDDDDEDVDEDDDDDVDEDGFSHFPSADGITIIAAGSTIITSSFPGRVFSGRRNRMEREDKKTLIIPTKRTTILCGENPTALVGSLWYLVSCVWRKCDCYHLCVWGGRCLVPCES